MSYQDIPTESSYDNSNKRQPVSNRAIAFWVLCLFGVGLIIVGLTLSVGSPLRISAKATFSQLLEIDGIIFLILSPFMLLVPTAKPGNKNSDTKTALRSKIYWFLQLSSMLIFLSGLVLGLLDNKSDYLDSLMPLGFIGFLFAYLVAKFIER